MHDTSNIGQAVGNDTDHGLDNVDDSTCAIDYAASRLIIRVGNVREWLVQADDGSMWKYVRRLNVSYRNWVEN